MFSECKLVVVVWQSLLNQVDGFKMNNLTGFEISTNLPIQKSLAHIIKHQFIWSFCVCKTYDYN